MKTNSTKPRIDYTQLAAQLNYIALTEKLERLRELPPPRKRKQIGDLLGPVAAQLRELRAKGWTYEQLSKELNDFGLPLKAPALRDYMISERKPRLRRRTRSGRLVGEKSVSHN